MKQKKAEKILLHMIECCKASSVCNRDIRDYNIYTGIHTLYIYREIFQSYRGQHISFVYYDFSNNSDKNESFCKMKYTVPLM